jgi:membrane-bound lytic murein transglycosylase B
MVLVRKRRKYRTGSVVAATVLASFLCAVMILSSGTAFAGWEPLIERLAADRFDDQAIRELFARPEVQFDPNIMSHKISSLIRNRFSKPLPYKTGNFKNIYGCYMKPEVIAGARVYLQENKDILERVKTEYRVPGEILVSILLVETRLGEYVGERCAFSTLASMALCTDLETVRPYISAELLDSESEDFARRRLRQKSDWAYNELKALIRYAREGGINPLNIPGSIYGAIGLCQFMPSHAANFGVDADGDGRVDLFSKSDAIFSIANYLKGNGWKASMSREKKHRVIKAYNPSNIYANTVLAVADKLTVKPTAKKVLRKRPPQINPA